MKSSYFLVIPKQQEKPERLREFEPKVLQQWIAELPTANPGLATRLVHDFLTEFNTIQMRAELRLDALELLRPSVFLIEDYLRNSLIKTGFPKEESQIKVLNVLSSVEKTFTIGYWIVLKELAQRKISWFQGKNVALAIQRTMKGLSSVTISHFLMGMSIPDWVWIDLHSLYKLSVKLKKDTIKVENPVHTAKPSSPEDCYRQILLLSLSNPTGLMQKEILIVYDFIETIGSLVSLKNTPAVGQSLQCVSPTDEDQPPFFQSKAGKDADSSRLYVDFTKLYKAFENKEKFNCMHEGRFGSGYVYLKHNEKPSTELLDYLIQRWSGIDLQGSPLFSDRLDRYMSIGLASTIDLQNSLLSQSPSGTNAESDLELLVQSESDSLLSCVLKKTGILSVGSLVSFRKTGQPDNNRIVGIVNKLEITKQHNKINFGIVLLASQSFSVTYLQINAKKDDIPQKALFYSPIDARDESYLITDNFILKEEDIIRMFIIHDNYPIILKAKKNISLGYRQFACSRISEQEVPPATPKRL